MRKSGISAAVAGLTLLCLNPTRSDASYISLKIGHTSTCREGMISARARITNNGDEPAKSVRVVARLDKTEVSSEIKDSLPVGETLNVDLDLGKRPSPAGTYTITFVTHYTDANGYEFSALSVHPVVTEYPVPLDDPIDARLASAVVSRGGTLALTLKSQSSRPLDLKATLALPRELVCREPALNVSLPPGSTREIMFNFRNVSALPGSGYPVFAIIDYELNGQHRSLPAAGSVRIVGGFNPRTISIAVMAVLAVIFTGLQFTRIPASITASNTVTVVKRVFPIGILLVLACFLMYHIPPRLLVSDTMTVGGDTPAHNYLASHMKDQLFGHGRIISWAGGWWCGFPMFQFYFPLPYLLTAVLSLLMPFNVAFKMISVLGIFLLPISAYVSARILGMKKTIPCLMAVAMIPILFERSHTMWGVNIYSTLAGMISNSLSFPVMLLFIASATRDADEGRFRLGTVFLLCALVASHFFTTIMAGMTLAIVPFLRPRSGARRAVLTLAGEALLGFALMAWWLVPLILKGDYSMEFGFNWRVPLLAHVAEHFGSRVSAAVLVTAAAGLAACCVLRIRYAYMLAWMFACSLFLFLFGYTTVSKVFVNVRLWPFLIYPVTGLVTLASGLFLQRLRYAEIAVTAAMLAVLTFGIDRPNDVRGWAGFNYRGLEGNGTATAVFNDLTPLLAGTPGRLANDLHKDNEMLGSSRIFECMPHRIGKPVIEGGIVNSAVGSMFSYYIQSETSENSAGHPNICIPAEFNFDVATKHLELFNVKHFIARSARTKEAISRSGKWKRLTDSRGWELYELTTHDGNYVFVPENYPVAVRTDSKGSGWKEDAMSWMYVPGALDQHFVLLRDNDLPDVPSLRRQISESQFRQFLYGSRYDDGDVLDWLLLGPFPYDPADPDPIDYAAISEMNIDPAPGDTIHGLTWRPTPPRLPVKPHRFAMRNDGIVRYEYVITYGFVNVFVPSEREALLHFSCDDAIRVLLNDETVVSSPITGHGKFKTAPLKLREGRNRLLVKIEQSTGDNFFHLRITDTDSEPFEDLVCSADRHRPIFPYDLCRSVDRSKIDISAEKVTDNSISFKTTGIGLPHIIKCMYCPNWKVRGAEQVFMVTPCFMLVYPEQENVELYYGSTLPDNAGRCLSLLGLLLCGVVIVRRFRRYETTLG